MRKTIPKPIWAVPVLLLTLAGCGGTGANPSSTSGATRSSPHGQAIGVRSTSLGKVLVDGRGRTLYMLTADRPGHSSCSSTCLAYWPPVSSAGSTHPAGVTAPLGKAKLSTGGTTLTVGGWPLYTFVKDAAPGDVKGEGVKSFGGVWYAMSPAGHPIRAGSKRSSGSSGGGYSQGGGGY